MWLLCPNKINISNSYNIVTTCMRYNLFKRPTNVSVSKKLHHLLLNFYSSVHPFQSRLKLNSYFVNILCFTVR